MIYLDFLFFLVFKYYSNYNEKGAESTSAGIIGGILTLNLLTIVLVIQLFNNRETYINKMLVILFFVVFQVYTYIRYIYQDKHSISEIEKKWVSQTESARKQIRFGVSVYGIVSVLGCFLIALYLGSKH